MNDKEKKTEEHCDFEWYKRLGPLPPVRSSEEEYERSEWLMLQAMKDAVRKIREREASAARAAAAQQKAKKAPKPKNPPLG